MATVAHWAAIAKGARSSGVGTTSEVGRELLEPVERGLRGLKSGGSAWRTAEQGNFLAGSAGTRGVKLWAITVVTRALYSGRIEGVNESAAKFVFFFTKSKRGSQHKCD